MGLFDQNKDFHEDVFRNIVSLRKSQDLFDDINEGDEQLSSIAILAESRVKQDIPLGLINRGFHYTTAITYPFETQPFMESLYSDGKFGVWYGSLELPTTIHETVFHMIKTESGIVHSEKIITRERAVYKVHCDAILIDLSECYLDHPKLIDKQYDFTQKIGRKLHSEGHPGLLAPSARCSGTNIVIFNPNVLSNPKNHCYLTYHYYPETQQVFVERSPGKIMFKLNQENLTRLLNVHAASN